MQDFPPPIVVKVYGMPCIGIVEGPSSTPEEYAIMMSDSHNAKLKAISERFRKNILAHIPGGEAAHEVWFFFPQDGYTHRLGEQLYIEITHIPTGSGAMARIVESVATGCGVMFDTFIEPKLTHLNTVAITARNIHGECTRARWGRPAKPR